MTCRCPRGWCYQLADCRRHQPSPARTADAGLPPQAGQPATKADRARQRALARAATAYRRRAMQPSPVDDLAAAYMTMLLERHEALIKDIAALPQPSDSDARTNRLRKALTQALAYVEAAINRRTVIT